MQISDSLRRSGVLLALVAGILLPAACQTTSPQPARPGNPVEGKQVSQALCGSCHAIEAGKASPNPAAPPFTAVLDRYGPRILAKDLENSVAISHLKMPTFYLGEGHGADIVAYLESLKVAGAKP